MKWDACFKNSSLFWIKIDVDISQVQKESKENALKFKIYRDTCGTYNLDSHEHKPNCCLINTVISKMCCSVKGNFPLTLRIVSLPFHTNVDLV